MEDRFEYTLNSRGLYMNHAPVVDEENLQDICGSGASLIQDQPAPVYGTPEYVLSRTDRVISSSELRAWSQEES